MAMSATMYSAVVATSYEKSALILAALTFVEKVAGINLDAYNVTYECKGPIGCILYRGYTETLIDVDLIRVTDHLEIGIEFIDNYLVSYRLESRGSLPILNSDEPLDAFDRAKEALGQYQLAFDVPYCSQLAAMIDHVTTIDRKQTIKDDCVILNFNPNASLDRWVDFGWQYEGALRKNMHVCINKDGGFLEMFKDRWGLARISDVKISVSEEMAVVKALDRARDYILELGATVTKIESELRYINSYPKARGGDCFILYPTWVVKLFFDKSYDGVHGYFVGIWADTGYVRTAMPQGSSWGPPPPVSSEHSYTLPIGVITISLITVFGAVILTKRARKKSGD